MMTNELGIYVPYWFKNWEEEILPRLETIRACGFTVCELPGVTVARYTPAQLRELRTQAEALGLTLTVSMGLARENDLASLDADIRARGFAYMERFFGAMDAINARKIGGLCFAAWNPEKPRPEEIPQHYAAGVDAARRLGEKAAEYGISMGCEVVNRFEQYLFNTAKDGVRFVEAVGCKNVGVQLDTFHMNIEEDSMRAAIETAGSRLCHFHVGERNRRVPGMGDLDWRGILEALHSVDYQGFIIMEPFVVPGGNVADDVSLHRDLFGGAGRDLTADAAQSRAFLRALMELC